MNNKSLLIIAALVATTILLLWTSTPYVISIFSDTPGEFGDQFGFINALFSGLAMGGIILTILLQTNELKLQREELKQNHNILCEQREHIAKQAFETAFFSLYKINNKNFEELKIDRHAGNAALAEYINQYATTTGSPLPFREIPTEHELYLFFHGETRPQLLQCFRFLTNLIKWIDQANTNIDHKKIFINVIKDNLTPEQIFLLFHFVLADPTSNNSSIIEQYAILEYFSKTQFHNIYGSDTIFNYYPIAAYGSRSNFTGHMYYYRIGIGSKETREKTTSEFKYYLKK